jgi:UDP-glucose 4-epimerase
MKALVTGVAGFIGSHLAEHLLAEGFDVVGVDSFTNFYPRPLKEQNLQLVRTHPRFQLVEDEVLALRLGSLLDGATHVFHLAAQPGVRDSWNSFRTYVERNLSVTHYLLEACRRASLVRFVFASSSSVYGDADTLPVPEDASTHPVSPYGITKLAAEQLCGQYQQAFGLPLVILRYFTVYGPRQRPDMAFHRFLQAALQGDKIVIYGDGQQTRDFTYVSDAVKATTTAALEPDAAGVFNIAGGTRVTLREILNTLAEVTGQAIKVEYAASVPGDARHTFADISRASTGLHYCPKVSLREGLANQFEWIQKVYKS